MSADKLSIAISKERSERKERAQEEERIFRQKQRDDLILRAANRKPGERVSYKERLAERHAFLQAGVFDAGLCRTSDDLAYDFMQRTMVASPEDVIQQARMRQNF